MSLFSTKSISWLLHICNNQGFDFVGKRDIKYMAFNYPPHYWVKLNRSLLGNSITFFCYVFSRRDSWTITCSPKIHNINDTALSKEIVLFCVGTYIKSQNSCRDILAANFSQLSQPRPHLLTPFVKHWAGLVGDIFFCSHNWKCFNIFQQFLSLSMAHKTAVVDKSEQLQITWG